MFPGGGDQLPPQGGFPQPPPGTTLGPSPNNPLAFNAKNPFRGFNSAQEEIAALQGPKGISRSLAIESKPGFERARPGSFSSHTRFLQNSSLGGQEFENRSDFLKARLAQLQGGAQGPGSFPNFNDTPPSPGGQPNQFPRFNDAIPMPGGITETSSAFAQGGNDPFGQLGNATLGSEGVTNGPPDRPPTAGVGGIGRNPDGTTTTSGGKPPGSYGPDGQEVDPGSRPTKTRPPNTGPDGVTHPPPPGGGTTQSTGGQSFPSGPFPLQGGAIQVGQDPFSQKVAGGIEGLINSRGGPITEFGQNVENQALNFTQPGAAIGDFGQKIQDTSRQFANAAPAGATGQQAVGTAEAFSQGAGVGGFGRGIQGGVNDLLSRGGGFDPSIVNSRLETAREGLDRQRSAQTDQLEAALADRGLVGSGANIEALTGLERDLGGQFAGAFRDIVGNEQNAANNRFASALQTGSGLSGQELSGNLGGLGALSNLAGQESSRQQAGLGAGTSLAGQQLQGTLGGLGASTELAGQQQGNLLNAVNAGTARQGVLSDIALRSLAENNDFTKFVAQFGLDRDKTLADIQAGKMQSLLPLLQSFLGTSQISNQGFIGR